MISRNYVLCLTCKGAITARIQIGAEKLQTLTFPCPVCGTEIRMRLVLGEPPNIALEYIENCERGDTEGAIVNLGAGFAIDKDKVHQDKYFPSFDLMRTIFSNPAISEVLRRQEKMEMPQKPIRLTEAWRSLQRAWRLHRTGQSELSEQQLNEFFSEMQMQPGNLENGIASLFAVFHAPRDHIVLPPYFDLLDTAFAMNPSELRRLASDFHALSGERFDAYFDLLSEYFRGYSDFSQTLVYVKLGEELTGEQVASSTDFDTTRMFYGNAFELLGSHLDFVAGLFNILEGRDYDKLSKLTLSEYRALSKASRTKCFQEHQILSSLVGEYDSTVRNASHHRWFRLSTDRTRITYRSGGTGAERSMSYAEYLARCNRLLLQLLALASMELMLFARCRLRV
jgi:hypothetical protein